MIRKRTAERIVNSFWFYTALPYIIFAAFVLVPFVIGAYYALTDWDGVSSQLNLTGFKNYTGLFRDEGFLQSFSFSLRFTLTACVLVNALGLFYAVLFNASTKWNSVLRVSLVLPNVIGGIILGFVWQFIFSQALPALGGPAGKITWLGDGTAAFWAVMIVFVWQQAGYVMLIYIAAISSISPQLFESAQLDGAGRFVQFRRITLPLIVPAFTVAIFIVLANSFKIFALIFSLTGGGPYGSTESLAVNIYNEAFLYGNYGVGSAKAIVFFIVVALMSWMQVRFTEKREVSL